MRTAREKFRRQRERFMQLAQIPVAATIGRYRGEILYWGFFEPRYWRNYLHTHSFYEVCFAYAGEGVFQLNGEAHRVRAGDLFIARPSQPHEIVSSRRKPLGIYFFAYTLPASGRRGDDALTEAFIASEEFLARPGGAMLQTLQLLADEAAERRPGYLRAIEALTTKLLIDVARAVSPAAVAETVQPPGGSTADALVRTASQYLRDNFSRPIGLRDVAAQVHVSERHLSRVFLASTGLSVLDYLIKARVETAGQMLLDRRQTIKGIALAVGYPNVRYFTTVFRRVSGLTPAVFRARGGTRFLKRGR